jgi:isopropylmalate/homocitrate/citramalate synthase
VKVGPRDDFQNVGTFIKTEDMSIIAKALIDSGVRYPKAA